MQAKGKGKDASFPYHVPVARVAKMIQDYIDKNLERPWFVREEYKYGLEQVGFLTGFHERRIYSILVCEYQSVTWDVFEKLLIGLDLMHLLQIPPEEGGFADLYECETEQPPLPPLTEKQEEKRQRRIAERQRAKLRKRAREGGTVAA